MKRFQILLLPVALLTVFLCLRDGSLSPSMLRGGAGFLSGDASEPPALLSEDDREHYQAVFRAQDKADWKQADALIRKIDNPLLLGHVLAERYLNRQYSSTPDELKRWLDRHADHPQAYAIQALAMAKNPSLKASPLDLRKPVNLSGYGDDSTSGRFANNAHASAWRQALNAWSNGRKSEAAKLFANIAKNKSLAESQSAAAAYWAYRAYHAEGKAAEAKKYLHAAANDARSFYSLLARKQLGLPLVADSSSLQLTEGDWLDLTHAPATRRAIALAETGATDLAEQELRALFPKGGEREKLRLLMLAHNLKLAPVQIGMARQLSRYGHALDFALYPVPHWQPQDGFKVDPALIYALARQESGFKTSAVSPDGAMGLMQLMPQTASMMKRRLSIEAHDNAHDPSLNMALGQNYVLHLLENGLVDGNLIYMLTAYNAGPARLMEWKKTFANDDPLLFVESIPFTETRAYVMQVMTNYWVYSELAGTPSRSLAALAASRWPSYDIGTPVAARAQFPGISG